MGLETLKTLFSLKGKSALIVGGSRGIGRIMAETYAEVGADIALAARNQDSCRATAEDISCRFGVQALPKAMDVRDSVMVNSVVRDVIEEFGKIDVLVNSAGVVGSEKPAIEMTDEDIDEVMEIDFRGTFFVSRAVAKEMVKRQSDRIINVASIMAKICTRNIAGYCASKAAVVQLTRVMALELVRDNIQVNVLCPGYFLTDFNRGFLETKNGRDFVRRMIPINRAGDVNELRSTALYLATCPPFLTGAELYVDGGHTIA